jgi:hypothetical protein
MKFLSSVWPQGVPTLITAVLGGQQIFFQDCIKIIANHVRIEDDESEDLKNLLGNWKWHIVIYLEDKFGIVHIIL